MAKRAGTARPGTARRRHGPPGPASEACRAQMGRRAAAGPARWHYSPSEYIVEFSKKCVVVGARTHNLVHKKLKRIHLTSAAAVLLCYMLNSYI
jgi:hypothetical protein